LAGKKAEWQNPRFFHQGNLLRTIAATFPTRIIQLSQQRYI
jgi:hypothetical protein